MATSSGSVARYSSPRSIRSRMMPAAPLGGVDHGLDRGGHAGGDLHDDHVRAHRLDRLVEMHVALVDRDAARVLDRVGDVLRGDRPEQAAVVAGLLADRQDGAVELLGVLLGAGDEVASGLLLGLDPLASGLDGALGCRGGELARDQEVAQVALRDVDDRALLTDVLDVLEKNDLGHYRSSSRRGARAPSRAFSLTYGSSASSRARWTAVAIWL